MERKTHKSALCLIPPEGTWEPIQAIREVHDRQFERWMPHVNLLYPFLPAREFEAQIPVIARAVQEIRPFLVRLAAFSFFQHPSGGATVWLRPEPAEPLIRLQQDLERAFPELGDTSRSAGGFTPHLSVGQASSAAHARRLIERLEREWSPLSFLADHVALIQRGAATPFRVARRIAFSGQDAPAARGDPPGAR
ncbi:MAG: 2'-5' RNA ligase family protein [Planctomycetes bacterium]|nr:2'-5' RNA ligase family protein [Planctomycetota bacterium]